MLSMRDYSRGYEKYRRVVFEWTGRHDTVSREQTHFRPLPPHAHGSARQYELLFWCLWRLTRPGGGREGWNDCAHSCTADPPAVCTFLHSARRLPRRGWGRCDTRGGAQELPDAARALSGRGGELPQRMARLLGSAQGLAVYLLGMGYLLRGGLHVGESLLGQVRVATACGCGERAGDRAERCQQRGRIERQDGHEDLE